MQVSETVGEDGLWIVIVDNMLNVLAWGVGTSREVGLKTCGLAKLTLVNYLRK